jgi:prolyl-tRNA synthetase
MTTEKTPSKTITPRAQDYAQWYQEVITAADLAEHSVVRGAMILKPYGYAIWERIQQVLDAKIKQTGAENVYFPTLIPKSFLSREASHVKGFAKEVAVVTHHRLIDNPTGEGVVVDPAAKLEEEYVLRPTSETVIHDAFSRWIESWRDLPLMINQWANVFRWEMRTRLFLRTSEFLWQEGHTAHATHDEAMEEVKKMLEVYRWLAEEVFAMPVVPGEKSESERFAGAERTFCIEAMMQDGKALQAGTSHDLGQNFSRAFNVDFLNEQNERELAWLTSWGVSTRLIGGLIMTHSDDQGLVLPPALAPIQVVVIPIVKAGADNSEVMEHVRHIQEELQAAEIRVKVDDRTYKTLGEKIFEWEKKGVPVRLEIGPRDLEKHQVMVARRDTATKQPLPIAGLAEALVTLLGEVQQSVFLAAQKRLTDRSFVLDSYDEFKTKIEDGGFFYLPWCGKASCEEDVKEHTKATIRCIPFEQTFGGGRCVVCGTETATRAVFARAY